MTLLTSPNQLISSALIQNIEMIQLGFTLSPGVPMLLLPAFGNRKYLSIMDTGLGAMTLGFDAAPSVGLGPSFNPAPVAGGQGSIITWETPPTNAIWAISTAGTTVSVLAG